MILKICGLALIGASLAFIMKNYGWRPSPLISVAAILTLLASLGYYFTQISDFFDTVGGIEGMETLTGTALKVLGIGYVSGISSDICREIGEGGIASALTLIYRLEILMVVFPMLIEIVNIGLELAG